MDTAQPGAAAETDSIANAADAFKAVTNPDSVRPRDEQGRYASSEPQQEEVEAEEPELEAAPQEVDEGEEAEAPEEVEQEAVEETQPMPPSWPADKAEEWSKLPAETRGFIAEREAERDRAVNAKFQESANARKAAAEAAQEAQAKRDELLKAYETVEALYKQPEPDPRAFGYGTQQYNEAGYHAALAEYQQNERALAQLTEQRESLKKQSQEDEAKAFSEWKQEIEAEYQPKLLADVPELTEPAKAEPLLRELVNYGIEQGLPADVFSEDQQQYITSPQLHLLWKAQQFDKLKGQQAKPKPKPAGPAVKPGVSSPRSAQKAARKNKDWARLENEGSIEAGAAVFKHFL